MVVIMTMIVFHVDSSGRHIGQHTVFVLVTVGDAYVYCVKFHTVCLMSLSLHFLLLKVTVFFLPLSELNLYFSIFHLTGMYPAMVANNVNDGW